MQAVKHVGWVGFERFGDEGCCSTFHYGSGCILIRNSVKKSSLFRVSESELKKQRAYIQARVIKFLAAEKLEHHLRKI